MTWFQKQFLLKSRSQGCYLITDEIVKNLREIENYEIGILNLFIQHTSAGLTLNENWDSDVRKDLSDSLSRIVPEDEIYRHDAEGPDDMPSHVKSSLVGSSISIPITKGKLATGQWQGIWLCEFRESKHTRSIIATIDGKLY